MLGMKAANSSVALHDEPIGLKKNKRHSRHEGSEDGRVASNVNLRQGVPYCTISLLIVSACTW